MYFKIILLTLLFLINIGTVGLAQPDRIIPYPNGYDTKTQGASSAYGRADVRNSRYFRAPDYYNMRSDHKGLTIISKFKTYQQTTEVSCGPAMVLMQLHYFGQSGFEELQLCTSLGTKGERDALTREIGTDTQHIAEFFKGLGWQVESALDNSSGKESFEDIERFAVFVQTKLQQQQPIMVESMYWGGHWRIIIGYDTMNTPYLDDDVLIFADPYDTQDHRQDGYSVQTLAGFYYTWKDVDMLPKNQRIQQWVVARPPQK